MGKWLSDELDTLRHGLEEGQTHHQIALELGRSERSVALKSYKYRQLDPEVGQPDAPEPAEDAPVRTIEGRVSSLDELLALFEVDLNEWAVTSQKVNTWEQHSGLKGLVTLFQCKATLAPLNDPRKQALAGFLDRSLTKLQEHAPQYDQPLPTVPKGAKLTDEPVLWVPSLYDSHIGMRAWGQEVGEPYDSEIAATGYNQAFDELMIPASLYNVERSLYVVGHDLLHVDELGELGRGGQTSAGTPQDVDTRPDKMFDVALACCVRSIDSLRAGELSDE